MITYSMWRYHAAGDNVVQVPWMPYRHRSCMYVCMYVYIDLYMSIRKYDTCI